MGFPSRIVDVAEHGRHLGLDRGFLVVSQDRVEVGRIPLDDVGAVIVDAHNDVHISKRLQGKLRVTAVPTDAP